MSELENCEPNLSRSRMLEQLKFLIRGIVIDRDFDRKWHAFIAEFHSWEEGPIAKATSRLNIQLELLRRLCAAFPEGKLNAKQPVVELVLLGSGARVIGDTFKGRQPNGAMGTLKVVRREVTDRFGVLYTLEAEDGSRFTQEFFD